MAFIWILAVYFMADVMGRGHDGDGGEDPPRLGGRLRGQHEEDVVPATKRRGKGKNLQLAPTWEANGKRPLPLEFDGITAVPVGTNSRLLINEASQYMTRNIPFDKDSWKKVPEAEKNAMYTHLQNKANKAKQVVPNRGGTSSYSNTCHKYNKSKIQNFHDVHQKDGRFDNPRSEEQYNALLDELNQQTQGSSSSNNSTPVDEASLFEKVLGARRGHIKGIGYKPSGTTSSAQSRISRPTQPSQLDVMLANPRFREGLEALMQSFSNEPNIANEENTANEDNHSEE